MSEDIEKFRRYVKSIGMSHCQETACLQALYRIMEHFADRQFGINNTHNYSKALKHKNLPDAKTELYLKQLSDRFGSLALPDKAEEMEES